MGRFLSPNDMASAKHQEEVFNSLLNRGEVKSADKIVRSAHVVCGCGNEGCIFLSHTRDETEEERQTRLNSTP